jgi:hypothetical protein
MADNLPLSCMFRSVPRVEQTSPDTNECIVEFGLQEAVTVTVYLVDSVVVGN